MNSSPALSLFLDLHSGISVRLRPIYRKLGICKTISGMILASQLFYLIEKHGNGFSISNPELAEQLEMTIQELKTAKKDILSCGFFESETSGIPPTTRWSINTEKLENLLQERYGRPSTEPEAAPSGRDPSHSPIGCIQPIDRLGATERSVRSNRSSLYLDSKEEEEAAPPPKQTKRQEQLSAKVIEVYNAGKPEPWPGKTKIPKATLSLIEHWVEELGEDDFIEHLTKALKYAKNDEWWGKNVLSLESLLRKTKTHLIEMAEKQNLIDSNPRLVRGYSSSGNGSPNSARHKKLTEFSYPPPPDLF